MAYRAGRYMKFTLQGEKNKKTPLDEFFPVQVIQESAMCRPLPFNGSGDIQAALHADGLAVHPADKPGLQNGETVMYIPFQW